MITLFFLCVAFVLLITPVELYFLTEMSQLSSNFEGFENETLELILFVIMLRYLFLIVAAFLRNLATEFVVYKLYQSYVFDWSRSKKYSPGANDIVSSSEELVSEIQYLRVYFLLPLFHLVVDLALILSVIYSANISPQILLVVLIFASLFAFVLGVLISKLGKQRADRQRDFSSHILNKFVSEISCTNNNSSQKKVFVVSGFLNFVTDSLFSIILFTLLVFIYFLNSDYSHIYSVISSSNFAFGGYLAFVLVPLLPRFVRNLGKVSGSLKIYINLVSDKIQYSGNTYINEKILINGHSLSVSNTGAIKVSGLNGSGKSTLLWNIRQSLLASRYCNLYFFSQGIRATEFDEFSNLSGGQSVVEEFERIKDLKGFVIILDEPLNSLDVINRKDVVTLIEKISHSNLVIFVDHFDLVSCDSCIFI